MTIALDIPRLVIAGTASGVGKTTMTVGLIRALRQQGLKVAVFKCGPDYLDPTYHARAAGGPCHNLDGWMMGREALLSTFARASAGADIALLEGVMGLFDGASATSEEGSTAQVAKWLGAPVMLVVDASGMARSIGAVAAGFASFDPELSLAALACNRVGSKSHLELLRNAVRGPAVLGGLPEEPPLSFPERHLGLRTADKGAVPDELLDTWGKRVAEWFALERLLAIARAAPPLHLPGPSAPPPAAPDSAQEAKKAPRKCRIGLAYDDAFHFYYEHNLHLLEQLGAELVRFSPVHDERLPDVDGLYLGGGYPELFAEKLASNASLREQLRAFAQKGGPIYAECGGLMYLGATLQTLDGTRHRMVGLLPAETVMCERLQALGYVEVETQSKSVLGPAGLRFRGHQFRYSELRLLSEPVEQLYSVRRRRNGEVLKEGYRSGSVLGSYVHAHWASNPLAAEGFVASCTDFRRSRM